MRIGLCRERPRLVPPGIYCPSAHGVALNEPSTCGVWAHTARGHGGQRRREERKRNAEGCRETGGEMKSLLKGFQSVPHKDLALSWWEKVRVESTVLC